MSEDTLKTQRERYRVFIEDVADGFYETDLKGNFIFFNDALCRIFGYPREKIQDRSFREFMDEANARKAFQDFNTIYRTGKNLTDIKWKIINRKAEERIIEISASLIIDDYGRITGFRGITRDVTDKHLAQKALKDSEQCSLDLYRASARAERRYRALLDFFADPVFVLDLSGKVTYLNPAFVSVFGWTLEELRGKRIPFVPEAKKEETRQGTRRLFAERIVHGFSTQRLTKTGRLRDVVLDAALFYEEGDQPSGQVITLRDVTKEKRIERSNQTLFRISQALHKVRLLDERLQFITREIREILDVEGASVILLDEEKKEFFVRSSAYGDAKLGDRMREIRFPADRGVAGHVYRTGKPLIVHDTSKDKHFFRKVDEQAGYRTRNLLDVPIRTQERTIGVLCAVNKNDGAFDRTDVDLLDTVAGMVALPIENARINDALNRSYQEVKSLNRAKDRVIDHLSHELKTPVSVLLASLTLLEKRVSKIEDSGSERILKRARRNLDRILKMQYQIEDILRKGSFETHRTLSALLDVCADELESLFAMEIGENDIITKIRKRIDAIYSPRDEGAVPIRLHRFVRKKIEELSPKFAHRTSEVVTRIEETDSISIPVDVISKVLEGLVRNAVENTPDEGRIHVITRQGPKGPQLVVQDFGIGIPREDRDQVFESIFSTRDTMQYSSRSPYDFNAGGNGFDLLRMKMFSERFVFKINFHSTRCRYIPQKSDLCPGRISRCRHCRSPEDCFNSGGTEFRVHFASDHLSGPFQRDRDHETSCSRKR